MAIDPNSVWVVGISMTKFGRYPLKTAFDLGAEAALAALDDAGVEVGDLEIFAAGSVNQIRGNPAQSIQKLIGQTGIPAYNVINACATGATAVRLVVQAIKAGEASIGIAVGCEQMGKMGLLGGPTVASDTFTPKGNDGAIMPLEGVLGTGLMPGVFAQAGMRYAANNDGVGLEQFARVAEKNHQHSTLNPLAQYQKAYSLEQIMQAEMIGYPNTLLMCCPTGDGAAGVVLVSGDRLATMPRETQRRAVKISASVLTSDPWVPDGQVQPDVSTLTRNAARMAYEAAGVGPSDLDLVELHDCFASAELIHYDNLELCEPGGAGDFIDRGAPWRDGSTPVNVSGGLLSKGHPLGATGVANIFEVATHLRGEAGDRQIEGATVGLTHVIGLGSACSIHILERSGL